MTGPQFPISNEETVKNEGVFKEKLALIKAFKNVGRVQVIILVGEKLVYCNLHNNVDN